MEGGTQDRPHPVTILIEEYKTLREECLQALRQQTQILQVGFAAIGVVVGIGIKLEDEHTLSACVLVGFVPLLAMFVVFMWCGELHRMAQAGAQISRIEHRWQDEYREWVATWESLLAANSPAVWRLYRSHSAVFLTILLGAVLGAFAGALSLGRHYPWWVMVGALIWDFAIFAGMTVQYLRAYAQLWEPKKYRPAKELLDEALEKAELADPHPRPRPPTTPRLLSIYWWSGWLRLQQWLRPDRDGHS